MEVLSKIGLSRCQCGRAPPTFFVRGIKNLLRQHMIRTCSTIIGPNETLPKSKVRVRFAPSPTGQLHLGGLRTALYNFLFARAHGGQFILRLEDTDQTRLVPGAAENLVEMLQWSGIQIDEGPVFGGSVGPYTQSKRVSLYWEHIQPLLQNGSAYYCFCTPRRLDLLKKDATRRGEVPRYDNRCRHLTPEETEAKLKTNVPYVIRLKLETYTKPWQDLVFGPITQDVASIEGDPVLLKSDRFPTYHFANVVDDHLMGITHVLRGVEWQLSTTKHILLYKAFGWKPPKFAHLPLLLNKDGTKLSKRQNDIHVQHFKDAGYFPDSVLNLLTSAGGGFSVPDTGGLTITQLIDKFDLSLLKTNSTRLELERVTEFNKHHLQAKICGVGRQHMVEQVRSMAEQRLSERHKSDDQWQHLVENSYIERVLDHCQNRITMLSDLFEEKLSFLWFVPDIQHITNCLTEVVDVENTSQILVKTGLLIESTEEEECQDTKTLSNSLRKSAKELNIKMKPFMTVLRLTLTGLKEGPGVAEIISILGKDTTLHRIQQCQHGLTNGKTEQAKYYSS